ncbi:xylulose 5-phosphate 3-epimerase, partial [Xanthomonas citri pv. citri]|nr:xylulose 5-phosphate 3-epimerase [Xanthomonas citri pv. citri]
HNDEQARQLFNQHANELWVEPEALELARRLFAEQRGERPLERDNPLALRHPIEPIIPPLRYRDDACSPMAALDRFYTELVEANPDLRARVGNPDELASNRLGGVLKALKHRVSEP